MKKIMIVDDEQKIREFISFFLKQEGFEVIEANNGIEALQVLSNQEVSLILLDLMMPGMNGFETCTEIRKSSTVPIIMLTAVEGENEHIEGYGAGVDDYITKPFKINILMAKINRILGKTSTGFVQYHQLKINTQSRDVFVLDQQVTLAPKEYELLEYLLENNKIALSRDQILESVWGIDFDGGTRVVDNHIKKLRNKLGDFSQHIKTVIGHGYKIEV